MRCAIDGCRRDRGKKSTICDKHRYLKRKEKDPIKWAYETLKRNSRRRGIMFDLTLEYFKQFCYATKLLEKRGREKDHYSIDRINNDLGYTEGNIQVLPVGLNSIKRKKLVYNWENKSAVYFRVGMNDLDEVPGDLPF